MQTYGSYFKPFPDPRFVTTPGWLRVPDSDRNPESGGMHAIVFVNRTMELTVVSFRGTDLNHSSLSGIADMCADKILWDNYAYDELPAQCHRCFPNPKSLDYLGAAKTMLAEVMEAFPDYDTLLTGHSLGAGLATILAVELKLKALAFSAPNVADVLQRLGKCSVDVDDIVVLANKWDPVYHNTSAEQVGSVCIWQKNEPEACRICYRNKQMPRDTIKESRLLSGGMETMIDEKNMFDDDPCFQCFLDTHVWSRYIDLIESQDFERPRCTLKPWPKRA